MQWHSSTFIWVRNEKCAIPYHEELVLVELFMVENQFAEFSPFACLWIVLKQITISMNMSTAQNDLTSNANIFQTELLVSCSLWLLLGVFDIKNWAVLFHGPIAHLSGPQLKKTQLFFQHRYLKQEFIARTFSSILCLPLLCSVSPPEAEFHSLSQQNAIVSQGHQATWILASNISRGGWQNTHRKTTSLVLLFC